MTLRLPRQKMLLVAAIAKVEGKSKNAVINEAIANYVEQRKQEQLDAT